MSDEPNECQWTEAQKLAFEQILQLMREHFEAGVFRVLADIDDEREEHRGAYHGGKSTAIGLCALQTKSLMEFDRNSEATF